MLNTEREGSRKQSSNIWSAAKDNEKWFIVVDNDKEKKLIINLLSIVNDSMKSKTEVMVSTPEIDSKLLEQVSQQDNFIAAVT